MEVVATVNTILLSTHNRPFTDKRHSQSLEPKPKALFMLPCTADVSVSLWKVTDLFLMQTTATQLSVIKRKFANHLGLPGFPNWLFTTKLKTNTI